MTNGEFFKGNHLSYYRKRLEILREMLDEVCPDVLGEPQWAVLKKSVTMKARTMYRTNQFEESIEDFARWLSADADTVFKLSSKTNVLVTDSSGKLCILKRFGVSSDNAYLILNRAVIRVPGDPTLHIVNPVELKIATLPPDILALAKEQVLAEMKMKESEKDLV